MRFVFNEKKSNLPLNTPNAFTVLRQAATKRLTPSPIKSTSNYDRVYNDIVNYLSEKNVTWPASAHIQLPQVCTYCGGTSGSLLKEDEVIDELKRKHMTVRLEFLSIIKTMDMNNASTEKVFIIYYSIAFDNLAN